MRSHLNILSGALRASHPANVRSRLLSLTGETALMTGRASWLLENRGDARSCWSLALDMARDAGDQPLFASALAMQRMLHSTIPNRGRFGDTRRALAILDEAEAQLGPASSPYIRVFVLASRAEDHAAIGDAGAAYRDLDRAESALEKATARDDGYFTQWDGARIAGYRGSCELALHRSDAAVPVLESALARTSDSLLGQRCAVITDLAAAYAQQREVERSCVLLTESLDTAERTGLSELTQRVFGARQHLGPWRDAAPVRQLDERLLTVV
jgi:tetratricopeptide (TPR) repeat protein